VTAENAYASLLKLLDGGNATSVVLAAGDEPFLRRVNVGKEIASEFKESAQRAFNNGFRLIEYDAGYTPDPDEIVYISASHDRVKEISTSVADVVNIETFKGEEDIIDTLRFYAAVVGQPGASAVFFRQKNRKFELQRSLRVAVTFSKGTFDKIGYPVYVFDDAFDCVAWKGFVFIRSVPNFQRIFGYFEELRQKGAEYARALTSAIAISNSDEFITTCTNNLPMIAKVARIIADPHLQNVTVKKVQEVGQRYNVPTPVVREDGVDKLVFQKGTARWDLLKVLDHAFYTSDLTQDQFEANSKRRLKRTSVKPSKPT
jgi:hypothetical protein